MVPQIVTRSPPNVVVLYHTLVADGALPPGYELEFAGGGSRGLSRIWVPNGTH